MKPLFNSDFAAEQFKRFAVLFQDGDKLKMKYLEKEAECRRKSLERMRKHDEEKRIAAREKLDREYSAPAEVPPEMPQRRAAIYEYVKKENAANSDESKRNE